MVSLPKTILRRRVDIESDSLNSQTGFNPAKAAPTANPVNPDSVIGVCSRKGGQKIGTFASVPRVQVEATPSSLSSLPKKKRRKRPKTHIDDPVLAEPIQQPLGDLVRSVVPGDLFPDDKDVLVPVHLFGHGRVEGVSDGLRASKARRGGASAFS